MDFDQFLSGQCWLLGIRQICWIWAFWWDFYAHLVGDSKPTFHINWWWPPEPTYPLHAWMDSFLKIPHNWNNLPKIFLLGERSYFKLSINVANLSSASEVEVQSCLLNWGISHLYTNNLSELSKSNGRDERSQFDDIAWPLKNWMGILFRFSY